MDRIIDLSSTLPIISQSISSRRVSLGQIAWTVLTAQMLFRESSADL